MNETIVFALAKRLFGSKINQRPERERDEKSGNAEGDGHGKKQASRQRVVLIRGSLVRESRELGFETSNLACGVIKIKSNL